MTVLRRRPGIASVAALGGITAALLAAHVVAPEWSRAAGLDVWNAVAAETERRATEDRRGELEDLHGRLRQQMAVAEQLATRLIDGDIPLAAAADEVMVANRGRDAFYFVLQREHPSATTERQMAARYLIAKVKDRYYDDPSSGTAVLARLEAEYRTIPAE